MQPTSSSGGPVRPLRSDTESTKSKSQSKGSKESKVRGGVPLFGSRVTEEFQAKAKARLNQASKRKSSEADPKVASAAARHVGRPPSRPLPKPPIAQSSLERQQTPRMIFRELGNVIGSAKNATNRGLFEMAKRVLKEEQPYNYKEKALLIGFRNLLDTRRDEITKELKKEGLDKKFDKLLKKFDAILMAENPVASSSSESLHLERPSSSSTSSRNSGSLSDDFEMIEEEPKFTSQNIINCMKAWNENTANKIESKLIIHFDGSLVCVAIPKERKLTNAELYDQYLLAIHLIDSGLGERDRARLEPLGKLIFDNTAVLTEEIDEKTRKKSPIRQKEYDRLFIIPRVLK